MRVFFPRVQFGHLGAGDVNSTVLALTGETRFLWEDKLSCSRQD